MAVPRSGKAISKSSGRSGVTFTIAGNVLIIAENDPGQSDLKGRTREDQMCMMVFTVLDISDPARPKKLADGNVLGTADMPSDIADSYFREFRSPSLTKLSLGCYHGIAGCFGVRTGGFTAHGSRLYIQSQTHLYFIGEK